MSEMSYMEKALSDDDGQRLGHTAALPALNRVRSAFSEPSDWGGLGAYTSAGSMTEMKDPYARACAVNTLVARGDGDPVNHPDHYTSVVPGIECIEVTQHFNFNLGNAIKYIWRSGSKGKQVEDLRKSAWYLQREIERLESL